MQLLLEKLGISVDHLKCLDKVFRENSETYKQIEEKIISDLGDDLIQISRELYVGGKKRGKKEDSFNRQMILGDIIEYIFAGRAYYYISRSKENFGKFAKLVMYCVNQLLLLDTITINPEIRKAYINELEKAIPSSILYEREGDKELATTLKESDVVIWQDNWGMFDNLVDSILPKTLGCPKELIVFIELVRLNKGLVIPLLLTQKILADSEPIAPPDFLVLKKNKEIFGIEVGYEKEGQSREFSLHTSIPTFAVDLANHMHNRCPKCGENILYCDIVIEKYADGTLWKSLDDRGKYNCQDNNCQDFDDGQCSFSNYYGWYKGNCFYGQQEKGNDKENRHYHSRCVVDGSYEYRREKRKIKEHHISEFFAQIPEIEGIANI